MGFFVGCLSTVNYSESFDKRYMELRTIMGNFYTIADQTSLVEPPGSEFISMHYIITFTKEGNQSFVLASK